MRVRIIAFLVLLMLSIVNCTPVPDGGKSHTHIRIHVPHYIHKHTHTIVKKIYIPVKEHKKETHKFIEDAW